jgi:hypothetical protein
VLSIIEAEKENFEFNSIKYETWRAVDQARIINFTDRCVCFQ